MKLTKKICFSEKELDHILGFTLILEKFGFCKDIFIKKGSKEDSLWVVMILDI